MRILKADQAVSTCPVLLLKIFPFALCPNQIHKRRCPVPFNEGRFAIVTDVGRGRRWTRMAHQTNAREADGEVVWPGVQYFSRPAKSERNQLKSTTSQNCAESETGRPFRAGPNRPWFQAWYLAGSRSLSEHAHPLRSVHPNRASGTVGQIKCNPARKWAAVINHHSNRLPVLGIHHRYLRSERQRAMCGRISAGIECLTTRRSPP